MDRINSYIVFNEALVSGSFEDYLEAAGKLADEKQMPVLVQPPYQRKFIVMPQEK